MALPFFTFLVHSIKKLTSSYPFEINEENLGDFKEGKSWKTKWKLIDLYEVTLLELPFQNLL